jgi:hypothetical protein
LGHLTGLAARIRRSGLQHTQAGKLITSLLVRVTSLLVREDYGQFTKSFTATFGENQTCFHKKMTFASKYLRDVFRSFAGSGGPGGGGGGGQRGRRCHDQEKKRKMSHDRPVWGEPGTHP